MRSFRHHQSCCLLLVLATLQLAGAKPWTWGAEGQRQLNLDSEKWAPLHVPPPANRATDRHNPFQHDAVDATPQVLNAALAELAMLESQPLCHRTAALFLIEDCHILGGKDEATVLTDTGPQIRDFVDSYAASLAICDLERGSFVIPESCARFREKELAKASEAAKATGANTKGVPKMVLTSEEIGACLSGLSTSDSAWNTWVSYRHKALRFCEAARAEKEKVHGLAVHKRLVRVLSDLTSGLESTVAGRVRMLDVRLEEMEKMESQFNRLWEQLQNIETAVSTRISESIKASSDMLAGTLSKAAVLDRLINSLSEKARLQTKELAEQGQAAVSLMSSRVDEKLENLQVALASSVHSTQQLAHQIEISGQRMEQIERRQESLQQGIEHLVGITAFLAREHYEHAQRLGNVTQKTSEILQSLETAALSVSTLHKSAISRNSNYILSLWPFAVCPVTTLALGSYGLQPSAVRNLALVALGEGVGAGIWMLENMVGDISMFKSALWLWSPPSSSLGRVAEGGKGEKKDGMQVGGHSVADGALQRKACTVTKIGASEMETVMEEAW
ncbi:hypothetical protein BROUX41_003503 [Berkeleyomyces rouxiae]|uniref:uncharacterized protein n=1 Tax=Berkeleyomyces rouxiae TaxID=2035830 RepID=UPI003B82C327